MSQLLKLYPGSSPFGPIEKLTPDNGNPVTPTANNINVLGGAGANGAKNIQTDGNPFIVPTSTLNVRLTDSILLPSTNASGSEGVIALGSTDYVTDRFLHNYGFDSLALGYQAGNLTGSLISRCVFIGHQAGIVADTSQSIVAIGYKANGAATSGFSSTYVGYQAGFSNNNSSNVGVGTGAGGEMGSQSVAVGHSAIGNTAACANSVGIGYQALRTNTGGNNVAVGHNALFTGTGSNNVAIGYQSGYLVIGINGSNNIYISNTGVTAESNAIYLGTQGTQTKCVVAGITGVTTSNTKIVTIDSTTGQLGVSNGTAVGETITGDTGGALSPTAGNWNIIGGAGANGAINIKTDGAGSTLGLRLTDSILLPSTNASGSEGVIALGSTNYVTDRFLHNYGTNNTFLGYQAGNLTLVGNNNVGIGYKALNSIRSIAASVSYATAIGSNAATLLENGGSTVAIGGNALASCVNGGDFIVAVGTGALAAFPGKSTGGPTAIGYAAQSVVNAQVSNVSVGFRSLRRLTTGDRNEAYGHLAGENIVDTSDNLFIYNGGVLGDANTIRIGNQGSGGYQQDKCFIAGITGVTTSNSQMVTIDSTTGQLGVVALSPSSLFPWSVISADQTAAVNNGYFCNKAGTLALALPATSAVGDVIEISNENTALGVQITQAAGQQILLGNTNTTLGAGGSLTSIAVGDTIKLVCKTANTIWRAITPSSWTIV